MALFLCLLRCKFWLEQTVVQSYNNRIKSNRLSHKCERRVVHIIPWKLLLTTQQTTYRFGAFGNSGHKSGEEHSFPSGKGRKKLFLAEIALIGSFGSKMPQVRILSSQPKISRKWGFSPHFRLIFCLWLAFINHFRKASLSFLTANFNGWPPWSAVLLLYQLSV